MDNYEMAEEIQRLKKRIDELEAAKRYVPPPYPWPWVSWPPVFPPFPPCANTGGSRWIT